MGDKDLFHAGYNRVYDSLERKQISIHVEEVMDPFSTHGTGRHRVQAGRFTGRIGEYLHKTAQGRGILKSAFEHNGQFLFRFSDSELASILRSQDRPQRDKRRCCASIPSWISRSLPIPCWHQAHGILTIGGGCLALVTAVWGYAELLARRGTRSCH